MRRITWIAGRAGAGLLPFASGVALALLLRNGATALGRAFHLLPQGLQRASGPSPVS